MSIKVEILYMVHLVDVVELSLWDASVSLHTPVFHSASSKGRKHSLSNDG